ncbi:MAG: membrane protein [Acidimicrobiia bacterium]|nr:MAG: membrane protein [Acidimicrobiia bacterium]
MIRSRVVAALLLVASACAAPSPDAAPPADLPTITPDQLERLVGTSDRPVVVNIWASWCLPCRSEAPLLRRAHEIHRNEIRFVGVAIQDTRPEAAEFLTEFGITYENYFDPPGAVRDSLGGFGVPITYFFAPGGELVYSHMGIIDERTLALRIDELLRS